MRQHSGVSNTHQYRASEERPLALEERTLLEWLIARGVSNASTYSSQIPRVKVVSRCTCGCPTIDLAVDGKWVFGPSEMIANAEGTSPEGIRVGVIVHGREGQLSELEVPS